MRVIAGSLKSRLFKAPPAGKTHPMGERVRGAIFNMLADMSNLKVLDAYAGSGSLSFEAISRGAVSVDAVEINKRAYQTLVGNIAQLGLDGLVSARRANVVSYLKSTQQSYDLILLDPPYQLIKPEALLAIANSLKTDGRLVLSYPASFKLPFQTAAWQILQTKSYAQARVVICSHRLNRNS